MTPFVDQACLCCSRGRASGETFRFAVEPPIRLVRITNFSGPSPHTKVRLFLTLSEKTRSYVLVVALPHLRPATPKIDSVTH